MYYVFTIDNDEFELYASFEEEEKALIAMRRLHEKSAIAYADDDLLDVIYVSEDADWTAPVIELIEAEADRLWKSY